MSTAISVALYPVVFFLLCTLPAWLLSRLIYRLMKPGRLRDLLFKERGRPRSTAASDFRRRQEDLARQARQQ